MKTQTKTQTVISAALVLFLAGQSGCSRSEDSKNAVRDAGRQFETIAAGDANASPSNSASVLRSTESMVAEFAGSQDGYAQAAALSVAHSKIGLAALASQDAVQTEKEAILQARVIRGYLNEWRTMSAIAEAASVFDPADGLKELAGLIAMRQEDIANYRTLQEGIENEINDLNKKIAGLEDKASTERNAGAEIELRIPTLSATEGAQLAERVREHTLRGDQYGLEAFRIQGRVDQLIPTREEYALNVKKAESQIDLLDASREELQARERTSKSDANAARGDAQVARDAVLKLIEKIEAFRSSDVTGANDKAISQARGAISAARDSKSETAAVGAMTKSTAMQILAESISRQASGHREAAIMYTDIAESGIPGDWVSRAEREQETYETLKADAAQNFRDAASALRNARVRGEAGDKLEAAAVRLDKLGGFVPEPVEEYNEDEEYTDESYDEFDDSMDDEDEMGSEPQEDDG